MADSSSDPGVVPAGYVTDAAQIFRAVVRRHGGRPALVWSTTETTTYDQLDRLSNRIARLLLIRNVRKQDPVCLSLEKELVTYACVVACLKIGAPYFVIDPANPAARTRAMLDRCRPALAITYKGNPSGALPCPALTAVELAALLDGVSDAPVELPWSIEGSDPAYIMFTSGSTGVPKGATISHSNLVNFISWSQDQFGTTPDDVFTNVNPLFFDNSVFDIYASLFAGAALVPFTATTMREPKAIVARIDELQCTVYFSVPSLLIYLQTVKLLGPGAVPSLRKIIFGGEGYPKPMLARLFHAVSSRTQLFNVYGPTECTCICSVYPVGADDVADPRGLAPLGRLARNFSYVIVDEEDREVRAGDVGELCLGGPCVGLGYYNDPEQTARAFIQHPSHNRFFDRVYRTGDLVREDPVDGKIHYVGRADLQIKHQGYRIELGEIEHALNCVDGVDEAAAVYQANGPNSRIVGVVASTRDLAPGEVRRALVDALPKFMVPERVVVVRQLLKNANGKIDRQAIAAALGSGGV